MNLLFIDGEAVETLNEVATETAQVAPAGSGWTFWIMIIAMIAIMYFFMWRPESKRRKQMENFRKGLKKGDKIITAGGIYGTIKEVHDTTLLIEVDSNVTLRIDKSMVAAAPLA
jgi:preprotein translocase subunit YajC